MTDTKHKPTPPQMDLQAFKATFFALDRLCKSKASTMARMLGINRLTLLKWYHTPPKQWYWPYVIYYAVLANRDITKTRATYTSKHTRTSQNILLDMNKQLSQDFKYRVRNGDHITTTDYQQAERILIREILRSKHGYTTPKKLKKKYSIPIDVFRVAARVLNIDMDQQGYGKNKDSVWMLPDEWGVLDYGDD